jgi:hypothetical protein
MHKVKDSFKAAWLVTYQDDVFAHSPIIASGLRSESAPCQMDLRGIKH